jgi:hypothetical protein
MTGTRASLTDALNQTSPSTGNDDIDIGRHRDQCANRCTIGRFQNLNTASFGRPAAASPSAIQAAIA